MTKVLAHVKYIYNFRYFWFFLARQDIISRNRRSKLGMLWLMVSPLLTTIIMAVVFGTIFAVPFREYASYLFIGSINWEVITSSVIWGGGSFQSASQYIRQINHRLSIYTLKASVVYMTNWLIANIGLFIWLAFMRPQNIGLGLFTMPFTALILFSISWSISTVAAYINVKYRDYQQVTGLVMQALWYLSPGFLQEEMFKKTASLRTLFNVNPITHIFNLQRKPLIQGVLPSGEDYAYALGVVAVFGILAMIVARKYEKKVIFYL